MIALDTLRAWRRSLNDDDELVWTVRHSKRDLLPAEQAWLRDRPRFIALVDQMLSGRTP